MNSPEKITLFAIYSVYDSKLFLLHLLLLVLTDKTRLLLCFVQTKLRIFSWNWSHHHNGYLNKSGAPLALLIIRKNVPIFAKHFFLVLFCIYETCLCKKKGQAFSFKFNFTNMWCRTHAHTNTHLIHVCRNIIDLLLT